MRPELDAALVHDFPRLYRDRHGDMKETLMCWGFDCDDGWEPLIRELSRHLEPHIAQHAPELRAMQVKEKFGTLRFYLTHSDEFAAAFVEAAESRSATTCEACGAPAAKTWRRNGAPTGWIKTLCAVHGKQWEDPQQPRGEWGPPTG